MLGVAAAAWAAALIAAAPLRRIWESGRALPLRPRRILRGFTGGPSGTGYVYPFGVMPDGMTTWARSRLGCQSWCSTITL